MKRIVIAVLLLAALALPAHAQPATFPDIPAGHWAAEAVAEITRLGILTGFPDGSFRGNDNLTRYQAALIIQRVLTVVGTAAPAVVDLSALRNAIQELSADLSALNVRVTQIEMDRAAVEQLRQTIAALQAAQAGFVTRPEFTELKNAVAALTGQVTPADLARLQQAIDALRAAGVSPGDIAALSQAVAQLQQTAVTADDLSRVQDIAVEARATALQALAAVEALRARPVEPGMDAAALADLSARVEANSVAVETALARTRSLAAAIDEIRAELTKLGVAPVAPVGVDPAAIEAQFLALRAQLEAAQQDVIGLSNLVVTLNNESIAQGTRLTTLEGRVKALEERAVAAPPTAPTPAEPAVVGVIEDQIAAVRDFVILVRRDVVSLTDRVTAIDSRVAKNAADIAKTTADIAKSTADIAKSTADIAKLRTDLTTLDGRVLKLSGNIAVSFNSTRTYASPQHLLERFDIDRLNVDPGVRSPFSDAGVAIGGNDNLDESRIRAILTLSASFARRGTSAAAGLNVHDISVTFNPATVTHTDPASATANLAAPLWTIARFTATFTIASRPFEVVVGVAPPVKFTEYVFDNDGAFTVVVAGRAFAAGPPVVTAVPTVVRGGLRGWRNLGGGGIRFSAPSIPLGLPVVPGFTFFLGQVSPNDPPLVTVPPTPPSAPWIVYGLRPTLSLGKPLTVGFSWVEVYQDHLYGNSLAATPWYHKAAGADVTVDLDILKIRGEFAESWAGQYIDQRTKAPLPLTFGGNLGYLTVEAPLGFVTVNANYRWLTPRYDGVSGDVGSTGAFGTPLTPTPLYGNTPLNAAPFRLNQYGFGANATVTLGDDFLKVVGGYDQATEFRGDAVYDGRGQFKFAPTTTSALTRTSLGAQATARLAALVLTAQVVSDAESIGTADRGSDFQIRATVGHDGKPDVKQPRPFIPGLTIATHYQSDSWTGSVWTNPFGRTDIGVSASFEIDLLGTKITPRAGYSTTSYSKDPAGNQVNSGNPTPVTVGEGDRTLRPLIGFTATIDPALNPSNAADSTELRFGVSVGTPPLAFLPFRTTTAVSIDYFSRNLRAIGVSLDMASGQDQTELRLLWGVNVGEFLFANSRLAARVGWIDIANTIVGTPAAADRVRGTTHFGYWLTWTYWDVSVSYGAFQFLRKGTAAAPAVDRWTWYDGWRISYTVNF